MNIQSLLVGALLTPCMGIRSGGLCVQALFWMKSISLVTKRGILREYCKTVLSYFDNAPQLIGWPH